MGDIDLLQLIFLRQQGLEVNVLFVACRDAARYKPKLLENCRSTVDQCTYKNCKITAYPEDGRIR